MSFAEFAFICTYLVICMLSQAKSRLSFFLVFLMCQIKNVVCDVHTGLTGIFYWSCLATACLSRKSVSAKIQGHWNLIIVATGTKICIDT